MARPFIPDPSTITAGSQAPFPILDRANDHDPVSEPFTWPGAANDYTVRLDFAILEQVSAELTAGGDPPLLIVPWEDVPGIDEVAVHFDRALARCNPGRESQAGNANYTPLATVFDAQFMASIQANGEQAADSIPSSEKGVANGVATLDSGGKIPSAQLSGLSLTDVAVVASQAAQLALVAEEGDVAIRSDQNKSYVHNGGASGTMADWTELKAAAPVLSVNGQSGDVELTASDINYVSGGNTVDDQLGNLYGSLLNKQGASDNLNSLSSMSNTGLVVRAGAGSFLNRSIAVGTDLTVTNGNGVSANPTISLGSNVAKKNADNAFSVAQTLNGVVFPPKSITTTATLLTTDYYHLIYATGGSYTITMPTASAALGQVFLLVVEGNHATNTVTLDAGVGNNMSVPLESFGQTITIDVTARRRWYLFRKITASLWIATAGS